MCTCEYMHLYYYVVSILYIHVHDMYIEVVFKLRNSFFLGYIRNKFVNYSRGCMESLDSICLETLPLLALGVTMVGQLHNLESYCIHVQ